MSTAEFTANAALLQELLTGQQEQKETLAKLVALVTLHFSQAQNKPPTQRAKKAVNVDVAPTVAVELGVADSEAQEPPASEEKSEAKPAKKTRATAKPKQPSKPAYITANWTRNAVLNGRLRAANPEKYAEIVAKDATDPEKGALLGKLFTNKKQTELLDGIDLSVAL